MKTQTIYVDACTSTGIAIGRRNTYATEQIVFGLAALVQQYGAGSAVLMVLRPTDTTPYPAVTSQSGTELTWTVSATDTSITGTGECELYWYVNGGLAKSVIFPLTIQRDIITEPIDEPPEPYQTWVDDLTELGAETLQNAQAAAQSAADAEAAKIAAQGAQTGAEAAQTAAETAQGKAEDAQEAAESSKTDAEAAARQAEEALEEFTTPTASANTLEPDEEATASYANGHFTFGIPQGVPGDPGVTPDFSIGTVQTLQPTEPATASITGTAEHPVLNLGIPQGVQGDPATNLVQSVNGKTGAVVLDAGDIGYDAETPYPDASVGKELSEINSALSSLSSVTEIIDTASGAIASFPDGSGLPMRSLVAQINPVQDLHGQSSPYPAGGGKNLCDPSKKTIPQVGDVRFYDSDGFTLKAGTTYTFSVTDVTSAPNGIYIVKKSDGSSLKSAYNVTSVTYSATEDVVAYFRALWNQSPTESIYANIKAQVEVGSSATAFAPFENLCPISGWTGLSGQRAGKNLFDKDSAITGLWDSSGVFMPQQTGFLTIYCKVKPNTTYTLSGCSSWDNIRICYFNTENPTTFTRRQTPQGSPITFTTDSDTVLVSFGPSRESYGDGSGVQLELGSTASTYEPYTGEAISVSFGRTVYGGTDEVIGGNGTSTMGMVDLGTLDWGYSRAEARFYYNGLDYKRPSSATEKANALCSQYKVTTLGNLTDKSICLYMNGYIYVKDLSYTDAADFKTAMSGVQLCYELATPTTFTPTPQEIETLYGQNNIWVDTGDVSVTYQASIKGYIDKVLGQ